MNKEIKEFVVKDFDMYECVKKLAEQERVLVGFEEAELIIPNEEYQEMKKEGKLIRRHFKEYRKNITLDMKEIELKALLDKLTNIDDNYFWEIENGIINILPKADDGNNKYSKSNLKDSVDEFNLEKSNVFDGIFKLYANSEHEGVSVSGYGVVVGYCRDWETKNINRNISLNIKNVTEREIINMLVKADGNVIWFLVSSPNRKTKSLWIAPLDGYWMCLSQPELEAVRQTDAVFW